MKNEHYNYYKRIRDLIISQARIRVVKLRESSARACTS